MKILLFEGGLGNQMFQYAFYLGEREKHGGLWLFDIKGTRYHHQEFELDGIFNICKCKKTHNFALKLIRKLRMPQMIVNEKEEGAYSETPNVFGIGKCIKYRGFWQNEKYFLDVENEVRRIYKFDESKLNHKTVSLYNQIKEQRRNYVSVHVRRGDYLDCPIFHVCTAEYYHRAMSHIKSHVKDVSFVVFSDDIPWCREQFGISNDTLQYVDWNSGTDSWQDMFLMSKCHHNIIANSSFSWWGAWLNDFIDKIVVAPSYWLADETKMQDVVPSNWVRI